MTLSVDMQLIETEKNFLAKRSRYLQRWPVVGSLLLLMITGLGVWLFFYNPLLANPFVVLTKLQNGSIPLSSLTVMAGLLPIAVLICLMLCIVMLIFCFAAFSNEKKYLEIINRHNK